MKTWLLPTVCVFALLLVPASFAITYTTINFPGAIRTNASGINSAGEIVGNYTDSSLIYHGFLLSNRVFTTIDPPGSSVTFAVDINDSEEIVGYYYDATKSIPHGFTLQGQTYTTIDCPGALGTSPMSINNAGEVVGYFNAGGVVDGFELMNGVWISVVLPHSEGTYITGNNNNGDLYGVYVGAQGPLNTTFYAFVLESDGSLRILQPPHDEAVQFTGNLNDYRQGVGGVNYSAVTTTSALLFQPPGTFGLLRNISTSQPPYMFASGINNAGKVVGSYSDALGIFHGFLAVR